jgi:hypothetical protein
MLRAIHLIVLIVLLGGCSEAANLDVAEPNGVRLISVIGEVSET